MTPVFAVTVAVAGAYVCGSIPFAYLAGRLIKGVDLRTAGSGNLGTTNVYREVGVAAAIAVLLCDAGKGWVAVALIPRMISIGDSPWVPIALGAAAVAGHTKPVFLLWRGGGKGVATGAGVFLYLAPMAVALSVGVFAIVVALTRYVSAGSVAAALALPIAVAATSGVNASVFAASAAIAVFVVWTHRTNLRRLSRGDEKRIGRPGAGSGGVNR